MKSLIILTVTILTVCLFCLSSAIADELTGRVIDPDGAPIVKANIQTNVGALKTETDDDGKFVLKYTNEIPTYFTISHVSFQPRMIKIEKYKKDMEIFMSPAVYSGQNIKVTAMRAKEGQTPTAFSDFSAAEIERDYTVADFPILLETTPNMYAYTYTGGVSGASDFKIRGFDYKRLGVYINGIPLNDPEDRFTYFYDLADFASEVADIQVQRGVGNSLYGDANFGGSINIASAGPERQRKIAATVGYGYYRSDNRTVSEVRKQAFEYSSGLIDGRWLFAGRYSNLYSGGYREQSWYDGWAYFFSMSRIDPNMTTTVNIYGGPMEAHLAFYGVDRETLSRDRRYNPETYSNQKDDFNQPHYELHNAYRLSDKMTLNNSFYYIKGDGYYEQYKDDRDIFEYGIPISALVDTSITDIDLIRQKWVDKNQYGWNPRLEISHNKGTAQIGGAFYYFNSNHYGQVTWAENVNASIDNPHKYYQYFGTKYSASIYAMDNYSLTEKINLSGNLQLRYLKYNFNQTTVGALPGYQYDLDWLFFSPRFGISYNLSDYSNLFFSFGIASREPTDNSIYDAEEVSAFPNLEVISEPSSGSGYIFGNPIADAERVYDFEIGGSYRWEKYKLGLNLFWMEFKNEIVNNGQLNADGFPQLGNVDRSVHSGVEFEGAAYFSKSLSMSGNFSYNHNRIKDHIAYNDIYYDGSVIDTVDYSDNPVGGFPEYLGNLIFDLHNDSYSRVVLRLRAIGRQYIENGKNDSLSIDPYTTASLSATVQLLKKPSFGRLSLQMNINNLFNTKYEQSGYAYIWWGDDWAGEYYVGPERNIYVQLKWELE